MSSYVNLGGVLYSHPRTRIVTGRVYLSVLFEVPTDWDEHVECLTLVWVSCPVRDVTNREFEVVASISPMVTM